MIRLLIRKSFYDMWDNLLGLVLSNLVCNAFIAGFVFTTGIGGNLSGTGKFTLTFAGLVFFCLYTTGFSGTAHSWTSFKNGIFINFAGSLKAGFTHFLFYCAETVFLVVNAGFLIPFYYRGTGFASTLICAFLCFAEFELFLSVQYYLPLFQAMPEDGPLKTFRKSLLLVTENFLFTVFLVIHSAFNIVLSAVTLFFLPGLSSVAVLRNNAVRLLLIRYDWMEEKHVDRHHIIVSDMLASENAAVGHRTLKDFFFPWKSLK